MALADLTLLDKYLIALHLLDSDGPKVPGWTVSTYRLHLLRRITELSIAAHLDRDFAPGHDSKK